MKKIFATLALPLAFISGLSAEESNDTVNSRQLDEIVVSGQSARQRVANLRFGSESLELSKLSAVPMLFGEKDILKSIALLPGVHGEGEGAGGFEVRGGTSSQNLVLLDGISLFNPSHVMGIFSTFNDDAVGRATLHKGPIPPSFGGATSSVLETSLSPGDMREYHGVFTVGILAAKIKAEGPVVKDKLSLALSARRSYVDMFLAMVPEYRGTVMNFYDVTAKMRYIPRKGDILDFSFVMSHDNMAIKDVMGMYWGNLGTSLQWHTGAGDRWRFTTSAAYNDYSPKMSMSMLGNDQLIREYIKTVSVNENAVYEIGEDRRLEFGVRSELLRVKSGEFDAGSNRLKEVRSGWQNAVWADFEGMTGERFGLSAGIRLSTFSSLSSSRFNGFSGGNSSAAPDFSSKTYVDVEPRASLKFDVNPCHAVKAGAGISTQNLHALRESGTSFPFDRYAVTSASVKPEKSLNVSLGYSGMTPDGAFDWSVDGYFRKMKNVYDYQDGRTMFSQINLESIILGGEGRGYGLELMLRKNSGKLTGWVSYTLSRVETRIPGINDGKWYNASNDRRHNISVVGVYNLNDKWSFSGGWTFLSGQPLTAPDVKYELDGVTCYYYSVRNGYRTPSTHKLDLSATYTHVGKRFTYQWNFGIYNAYCHYNPFIVYFEDDKDSPSGTRAVQQSLYGLLPSVSYTLKF